MKKRLIQTTTGSPGFPRRSRRARPESARRERPRRRPPPSAGMLAPSRGEEERTTRTPLGGCWKRGWRRRRGISRRAPRTPGPPTTKTAPRSCRARLAAPSPFAAAARRSAAGASRLGSWTPPSSRTSASVRAPWTSSTASAATRARRRRRRRRARGGAPPSSPSSTRRRRDTREGRRRARGYSRRSRAPTRRSARRTRRSSGGCTTCGCSGSL